MKGIIADCMKEMVVEKKGAEIWKEIVTQAGLPAEIKFSTTDDVDDQAVLGVVKSACKVLGATLQEVADMFGSYWMTTYAKRSYSPVYKMYKSAREFIFAIDDIHRQGVKYLPGAKPPRFTVTWQGDKTLLVDYRSERGLIEFAIGLARGIGENFGEPLQVTRISDTQFQILFP